MSEWQGLRKILVVEDDAAISTMLVRVLVQQLDAETRTCATLAEARASVVSFSPQLVLLDLGLPDGDGLGICQDLRLWSMTPIIVVSAHGDEHRRVEALDAGADDFLVKPFSVSELLARIRSVWRRTSLVESPAPVESRLGNLSLDPSRHVAMIATSRLHLTPKEFALLEFLTRNSDRISSHREILREVWGRGYVDEVHYVRNVVKALRMKLIDAGSTAEIVNERGIGYRLECSDVE
jgi:two-component system KDP operon response regulator KdpE